MALNIAQVEDVHGVLGRLPRLVDLLHQRAPEFYDGTLHWLQQGEQVCERHRLPAASELAALRALLLQAARGQLPQGVVLVGRPTRRKMRDAVAAHAVDRGGDILRSVVQRRVQQLAEGETLAGQIAAVARVKGLVRQCAAASEPTQQLPLLRELIERDADLVAAHTQLVGLLGRGDALAMLDRALPEL